VLNAVGLGCPKAGQDLEIRIPAGQPQHVAGLHQNKRTQKVAYIGKKAEIRGQINKYQDHASDQRNRGQYQHIKIEAEENAGDADEEQQHFESRSRIANAGAI
jgi:hypothetical protein